MTFCNIAVNRAFLAFSLFCFLLSGIPAFAVAATPETKEEEPAVSVASAAPDFELPDLNGSMVTLSKLKGQKPVLIYFWATWCAFCLSVRPAVINLRNEIAKSDLELLAINVGGGDSLARVKRFEEAHPAPYTVLYDAESKVARSYQVQGIPHFVLIDKEGVIKYSGNELPPDPMQLLKQ